MANTQTNRATLSNSQLSTLLEKGSVVVKQSDQRDIEITTEFEDEEELVLSSLETIEQLASETRTILETARAD